MENLCKNCLIKPMCNMACNTLVRKYLDLYGYTVKESKYSLYRRFAKLHIDKYYLE